MLERRTSVPLPADLDAGLSGRGEKLGTDRSVHAAQKAGEFFRSSRSPWDRVVSPQFFAWQRGVRGVKSTLVGLVFGDEQVGCEFFSIQEGVEVF